MGFENIQENEYAYSLPREVVQGVIKIRSKKIWKERISRVVSSKNLGETKEMSEKHRNVASSKKSHHL